MNKMRNVDISFACMGGLFKAGEMMSGTLGFTLIERMAIKEITLTIHGRAEVSFQAGKYTYSKKEKYMKETKSLFPSSGEADDHPALNPGNYTFSFEHLLNSTIPSSFEGKYGHVRYSVEVKIDRGIWKPAITKSRKFIIKNDLDLNGLSSVQEPVRYDSSAVDGCCCWKQGKLDVTVRLPRKGYVPGEAIYLDADVNNATTSRGHVSVELIQFTTYYTRSGSKRWRQTLYTRPRVTLGVGESLELSGEPIHVPQLPPSGLPWCKLVDIVYTLRIKVKVRGLECKIPINLTIGTIPLRSVFGTPMLTPPPYQQEPEPFSSLWENPPSPPTSLPSPWEVTRSPWELPPSPPGYTALPSPTGPLPPRPPPYEETQPRRTMENLDL